MADFKQAIQWMNEGKKVRRNYYHEKVYTTYNKLLNKFSDMNIEGEFINNIRTMTMTDFKATDWEIFHCIDDLIVTIQDLTKIHAKRFIKIPNTIEMNKEDANKIRENPKCYLGKIFGMNIEVSEALKEGECIVGYKKEIISEIQRRINKLSKKLKNMKSSYGTLVFKEALKKND